MKWLRRFCEVLEYGPFLAALLPTLIVLLAAGVILAGGEGARLGHLVASSRGDTRRISRAIGRVREHFNEPLKIEAIARDLGMSVSGFHHHFK